MVDLDLDACRLRKDKIKSASASYSRMCVHLHWKADSKCTIYITYKPGHTQLCMPMAPLRVVMITHHDHLSFFSATSIATMTFVPLYKCVCLSKYTANID